MTLSFPVRVRAIAGIVAAALSSLGCGLHAHNTPARTIDIVTGDPAGLYASLGYALARVYTDSVGGVRATAHTSAGLNANLDAIERHTADVAFATADVVYAAYTHGTPLDPHPHRQLRAIAVLYPNVLQIVVKQENRITRVTDLRHARVGMAVVANSVASDPGTRVRLVDLVSEAHDMSSADMHVVRTTFGGIVDALERHAVDSEFVMAGYPVAAVTELAGMGGVRLLGIDRAAAARIRGHAPFYKPAVIPSGTYEGQTESIHTIGVDNLLICRSDLDEALVYRLTKAFFDSLPQLADVNTVALQIHPDLASATPIPLHPGAAIYYREYELLR